MVSLGFRTGAQARMLESQITDDFSSLCDLRLQHPRLGDVSAVAATHQPRSLLGKGIESQLCGFQVDTKRKEEMSQKACKTKHDAGFLPSLLHISFPFTGWVRRCGLFGSEFQILRVDDSFDIVAGSKETRHQVPSARNARIDCACCNDE